MLAAIELPSEAKKFIYKFDSFNNLLDCRKRLELEPISFEIDVPEKVIDMITIDHALKVLADSPSVELVEL